MYVEFNNINVDKCLFNLSMQYIMKLITSRFCFFFFFATSRLPDLTFNQSHNDLLSYVNVNNFIKMVAELPNLQRG